MAAKKCPQCNRANDFFVNHKFEVRCGYCEFKVARIKDQFLHAECVLKIKEQDREIRNNS